MAYTPRNGIQDLLNSFNDELEKSLKTLLENKHLYQNIKVMVNGDKIKSITEKLYTFERSDNAKAIVLKEYYEKINDYWEIQDSNSPQRKGDFDSSTIYFHVTTIKTYCQNCKRIEPYNKKFVWDLLKEKKSTNTIQLFALGYQCQACKSLSEIFLIRREGSKLILSGRSPMEKVNIPKYFPEPQCKYYIDALIAYNSGKVLAGLFYLRVFIEQFTFSIVNENSLRADELVEKYMESLPDDFKRQFPSLKKIYGKLSEAIHNANESEKLFKDMCRDMDKHFDARRVHDLN